MLSLGYCILGVMLCITTFFLAKKHPNRISNGFILELAVILLLESLLGLTAAHMGASPWLMGVAYVLAYIRPVLFVILGFALLVTASSGCGAKVSPLPVRFPSLGVSCCSFPVTGSFGGRGRACRARSFTSAL